MTISTIRHAYSLHVLRATLGGYRPLTLLRFARSTGFQTGLNDIGA